MAGLKKTSFVTHAAVLVMAGLLVRFIGFLYRLPLTDLIGDQGNGIYSAGYYLYMLFLIISSAGLPAAISKMVSERLELREYRNAHEVFKVSMIVAGFTGFVCSIILGLGAEKFAEFVSSPLSYWSIITLSPTIFIVALMAVFRGYFQGMNNTIPTAISQVIEQILNAVFSVYLAYVFIGKGIEYGAAGGTAGTGIGALAGLLVIFGIYMLVRPVILKKVRSDKNYRQYESRKDIAVVLLKTAAPIIIGTAIFSIANLIDVKMVMGRLAVSGKFTEEYATVLYGRLTGKYNTITTLPVAISTAMATASIPAIAASMAVKDRAAVKSKINTTFRLSMMLSIPAAIGIGVLGRQIMLLLFPKHPEGWELLTIGSISIILLALSQVSAGILQSVGRLHIPAISAFAGAIIKIILNYVLIAIPEINVMGAVISTIACYAVASVINLYSLAKLSGFVPDMAGGLVKPLFASLIMGLSCYVAYYFIYYIVPNNTLSVLIAIIAGVATYFFSLLLIRGVNRYDLLTIPMGYKLAVMFKRFL